MTGYERETQQRKKMRKKASRKENFGKPQKWMEGGEWEGDASDNRKNRTVSGKRRKG